MIQSTFAPSLPQEPENKQQQVYRQMRDAITRGQFPPGTVMVERKLCDLYGVSRSPIRNALQQLTFEGFLSYQPGKGTVVPEFTLEDILEVYDLIEVLQLYAARLCIHRLDTASADAMEHIMSQMEDALARDDLFACAQWDQRLHEFLISNSGNHRLQTLFDQLHNQQVRFIARTLEDREQHVRSCQEHRAICDKILARDIAGAEAAIRYHYDCLRRYYINLLLSRERLL